MTLGGNLESDPNIFILIANITACFKVQIYFNWDCRERKRKNRGLWSKDIQPVLKYTHRRNFISTFKI